MNKITTALLGLLLMILGSSCHSTQAVSESDYDLIAILSFDPTVDSTAQPKYLIKNLDGTPFDTLDMNAEYNFFNDGSPKLSGKIVFFFSDQGCYHFFCKKPEEGKPIEVRVGNEWKILERAPSIHVDSTSKYLQDYMFSPLGLQNEPFDIDFYPSPKADPAKKITLMQDSFGMKDFFVREIQGEWMKLQECIDYGPLYAEDAIVDEEGWEKISKLSEKNPIYWIRWRKGDKILTPQTEFYFKYGCSI